MKIIEMINGISRSGILGKKSSFHENENYTLLYTGNHHKKYRIDFYDFS